MGVGWLTVLVGQGAKRDRDPRIEDEALSDPSSHP
jgi:hypothetical protein